MSLRISRNFGHRGPSQTVEPNKKYIFIFEGEKTEKQYFEGVFNNRIELGIKDIVNITTLERIDPTHSNQEKIVKNLHKNLTDVSEFKNSKNVTIDKLQTVLKELNLPNSNEIIEECTKIMNDKDKENLTEVIDIIEKLGVRNAALEDFIEKLKSLKPLKDLLDYEEDYDTVCIIIDRDRGSFTELQYDTVLEICKQNNYKLGISNPCFEFWLLLHHTDCLHYEPEELIKNKRVSNSRRYLESLLVENIGTYQKNKINFKNYKDNIRDAIIREKQYCEDTTLLKKELGSSVGILLEELLD
ncbi:RloB family protein [Peribacillus frigoritolerans]|uniref:RloB family protein n=1 Tax=Peribacillus frigoritolerans TaxID=450367 RepID=UPI002E1B8C90|nr:RloB family protein [Peribacillus frigoritolerans]